MKIWNIEKLSKTPKSWCAAEYINNAKHVFYDKTKKRQTPIKGVKPIWIEGGKYNGKSTRFFAWYGLPENASPRKKVPAIVLVHGGGGSAFANWVAMWNKRGYAAIAMDNCGTIPTTPGYGNWQPHPWSGPTGPSTFLCTVRPPQEQWAYHAVASVILSNSFIRSLPEVNPANIAISGVSWGGWLTSMVIGLDKRFKCAVPIYGCGNLDEDSIWQREQLQYIGQEKAALWYKYWEPSQHLPQAKLPTLWVTGTNDFAYNLRMLEKSRQQHGGNAGLSIRLRYGHSHHHGWDRSEVQAFIDGYCLNKNKLTQITSHKLDGLNFSANIRTNREIIKAQLLYSVKQDAIWSNRLYQTAKAQISGNKVIAKIPENTTACFINVIDKDKNIISTPVEFPAEPLQP